MFKNYVKAAWRNLWKHKVVTYINLGGLAFGITAVLLIGIYIQSELSYDRFQANRKDICRVGFRIWQQGVIRGESAEFTAPFGLEAKNEFPEIKSYCRISESHTARISYADKQLKTSLITYADPSFFNFFSFRLLHGNPVTALQNPNTIVLSKGLAGKIFGKEEAVGKSLSIDGRTSYLVTGIVQDVPPNSTLQYEAILSLSTLYHDTTYFMGWNGGWQYDHYLQLQPNAGTKTLEGKFKDFMQKKFNEKYAGTMRIDAFLEPLSRIHLFFSPDAANTRTNLYVFGIIALMILVISCINYINLSVAQASARFKEIGVRKVLGALRLQLIKQFLGETLLVTVCALLLAAGLTIFLFPLYADISGKAIVLDVNEIYFIALIMFTLIILISLVTGGYLSVYLSALNPAKTLQMKLPKSRKHRLGRALMLIQFVITTALVSSVFVVHMQLRFMKNKPLGFDKEQVVILALTGNDVQDKAMLLKRQVASLARVTHVSAMSEIPYNSISENGFLPEGTKNHITVHQLDADEDLLNTLHIQLLAGRFFAKESPSDADGYIINQALADKLGWKDPLAKTIKRDGTHKIIGVVNNFHFASLHDIIEPLIITNKPWMNRYGFLAIKYNAGNPSELISQLQTAWRQTSADSPLDYWFLDEAFDTLYKSEERFRQLFFGFSVLSIFLSLAGVFGLVLLTMQQKTKEIGIRKVLGAGTTDIIRMGTNKFLLLIVAASLIAVPVAWYYANNWLQNFAYRIDLKWWMFTLSGFTVLGFTLLIICIQSTKAAMANPVKSLKVE